MSVAKERGGSMESPRGPISYLKTKYLPAPEVRDLPEPPRKIWPLLGPSIIMSGVGIASGEFILWPYITSRVGFVFLWAAFVGLTMQFFLNTEIERYTLATGETALAGFNRHWKHWGLIFAILCYFQNLWPGWVTSSATMVTYLFGVGDPKIVAIIMLVAIGAILTLAPVVYVALERLLWVKVVVIVAFFAIATVVVVKGPSLAGIAQAPLSFGYFPAAELGMATLLGALAFAGAGGAQNLVQSNWIRDKGFGMGRYIPRLVSPVTGGEVAAQTSASYVFEPTELNQDRWRRWWRFANIEVLVAFVGVTFVTITLTSLLAHATLRGRDDVANDIGFLRIEGEVLAGLVGGWFGALFWIVGAFSLFAAAAGIVDYASRLPADVLKSTYLKDKNISESKIYFILVWSLVAIGIAILSLGLAQPIILLVIAGNVAAFSMFIYSGLLAYINRKSLNPMVHIPGWRIGVLVATGVFFGTLTIISFGDQITRLFA